MNKQSLYVFGGALLASTALTTASHAALIKANNQAAGGTALVATTAITAKGLATQVFSGTAATAGAVIITNAATANGSILIDYNSQITSPFNIQLDISGAEFTGTPTLVHYYQSTSGGSLELASTVTGCSVQTLSDKILISGCDPTGSVNSISRVDALGVVGLGYTSAGALATAGTSITLSGLIRNSANTITFENITAAAVITSKSASEGTVTASAALTVDNTASPAFASISTNVLTTNIGSVHFSATGAVGTDLSFSFTANSITSSAELKVTHGVLSDDALVSIQVVGVITPLTRTPAQFVSGTVSFQLSGLSLNGANIQVAFNGTSAIDAATGSATVTPATAAVAPLITAVGSFSGSLAALTRGGLSIQLNTLLPTASTNYASFVRLANTSTLAGTATVTVSNDSTGAALGTYTTASIPAGGTLTISSTDIETALSLTSSASVNYKVTLAGSFNGYAQHLVYNKTSGVFSDFSGFRNGALTIDP